MITKRLSQLKDKFYKYGIDGYVVPKNDEFFSEYSQKDRLKTISNFTGSAGFAIILKDQNYLFVDGRYTIQAEIESGKDFKIKEYVSLFLKILLPKRKIKIVYDKSKPNGTPRKVLDVSLAKKYGWIAKTSIKDAVFKTYDEYKYSQK